MHWTRRRNLAGKFWKLENCQNCHLCKAELGTLPELDNPLGCVPRQKKEEEEEKQKSVWDLRIDQHKDLDWPSWPFVLETGLSAVAQAYPGFEAAAIRLQTTMCQTT